VSKEFNLKEMCKRDFNPGLVHQHMTTTLHLIKPASPFYSTKESLPCFKLSLFVSISPNDF